MSDAPAIDQGDASGLRLFWRLLIEPAPGRLKDTLRVIVLVLTVVTMWETFRIPETALAAYIVLFLSRPDAISSALAAAIGGGAVILAVFATIGVMMFGLAEPALRVPLIAAITFIGMFLVRTGGKLAPAFFLTGFIGAYGLTLGDQVLGLAMQPGTVSNTAEFTLPEGAFMSPEEALLRFVLWLTLVCAIPAGVVIIANLLTGQDPAVLLRAALVERLKSAARFCEGEPEADDKLKALALEGTAGLLNLRHLASLFRRTAPPAPIAEIERLLLLLLALNRIGERRDFQDHIRPVAEFCRQAALALAAGRQLPSQAPEIVLTGAVEPLGSRISAVLRDICAWREPAHAGPAEPRGLLVPDTFTNPEYIRFALKVTLAVLLCYAAQAMLDWPGIHTCIITCFFVSLAGLGETLHKATLRLTGCIIGAAMGIGTILLLMPLLTDVGDLLLVVGPVTFLAAWIGFGSERISYAGWQIGLAFYLSTFQGFGPTLNMEVARDRAVGLMLGSTAIYLIFTTIWPVSTGSTVRRYLVTALEQLAALLRSDEAKAAHPMEFMDTVRAARSVMVNEPLESRVALRPDEQHPIDQTILAHIQALIVPIMMILDIQGQGPISADVAAYHARLAAWFQCAADWVRDGSGGNDLVETLPQPPASAEPLQTWHRVLYQDISAVLAQTAPRPLPIHDAASPRARLAPS